MFKYVLLFLIGATGNMDLPLQFGEDKSSIDAVFVEWNEATLKSLSTQSEASSDSTRKAAYSNRSWGMQLYWNITASNNINKQSIRYHFLEKLFSEDIPKDIYVVETRSNGGKLVLRNFVVYKGKLGDLQAQPYMYFEGKWQKRLRTGLDTGLLNHNLSKFILNPGRGFNSDDIIISHFRGQVHKVVESEYYLGGTLAIDSGIKRLIDEAY